MAIDGRRGGDDGGVRAKGDVGEGGMRATATVAEEDTMAGARAGQARARGGRRQEREEAAAVVCAMHGDRVFRVWAWRARADGRILPLAPIGRLEASRTSAEFQQTQGPF